MTWIEKAMQLVDDYTIKQGALVKIKPDSEAFNTMRIEVALARLTLMSFLEAAKPAQVPHEGLTQ